MKEFSDEVIPNKSKLSTYMKTFYPFTKMNFQAEEKETLPKIKNKTKVNKKQLRKLHYIFKKYASETDSSGEIAMNPDDFIRSIVESQKPELKDKHVIDVSKYSNLKLLFSMADSEIPDGKINFSEYLLLFQLLTTPETEYEMAFRMFDPQNTGTITKEGFKKVLQSNEHVTLPSNFDFDCDLMKTFFGKTGSSKLSFVQFSQFMISLQEEIRKQEFQQLAVDGTVSAEEFSRLMFSNLSQSNISDKIFNNIKKLADSNIRVSYAEFDGYNKVLRNIDPISQSIRLAAKKSKDGSITRGGFSLAAKRVTGLGLSPMEVDIIFKTFSSDENQKKLYPQDYEEFINIASDESKRRSKVFNLWLKDEISDDGVSQATKLEIFQQKVKKFSLKTLFGGAAGAVGATAVYPIDLVKTRMQNQREGHRLYKNSGDCFKQIYAKEGLRGFYRGLVPQLVGVTPEKAIKLVVNDILRDAFGAEDGEENIALETLAGCGAGGSQVIFTNPIEVVKIRLQIAGEIAIQIGEKPKGAVAIVKELGFSGLYKGASACFLRDIPFSGIYFPLYGNLKKWFKKEGEEPSAFNVLTSGSLAGAVAASLTTPIDVVKTRLQVQARAGQESYTNILDCFYKIGKNEGFKAFWKGVLPRTFRSSPQFGITLLTYEYLQKFMKPSQVGDQTETVVGGVPITQQDLEGLQTLYQQKTESFKRLFGNRNK
eukprot:gene1303-11387_t